MLALDGGSGAAVLVDSVEQGMAEPNGGAAPTVAGKEIAGVDPSSPGVVVHVPLDAQIVNGLEAQARNDGSQVAWRSEEGNASQVECGVEDVSPVGNEGAAEVGVEKVLLGNLPTGPLARFGQAAAGCLGVFGGAGLLSGGAQIEALRKREADFIGVGGDVRGVGHQYVLFSAADAAYKPVSKLGLDDVAQFPVPVPERKIALHGRWADVQRNVGIGAVKRFVADRGSAVIDAGQIGDLADGIEGVAQRGLGNHTPPASHKGQG